MTAPNTTDPTLPENYACIYVARDGRDCKLPFGHDGRHKLLLGLGRLAPERLCAICQEPASMSASLGLACPGHYDTLSG